MPSSKNMTVSVGGIEVTIQTDEDRAYIQQLAAKVDEKVVSYLKMGAKVTVAQAAVLSALELCDEFEKNNAAVENMRSQMRSYIDDAVRAASERDRYKAELDKLSAEEKRRKSEAFAAPQEPLHSSDNFAAPQEPISKNDNFAAPQEQRNGYDNQGSLY